MFCVPWEFYLSLPLSLSPSLPLSLSPSLPLSLSPSPPLSLSPSPLSLSPSPSPSLSLSHKNHQNPHPLMFPCCLLQRTTVPTKPSPFSLCRKKRPQINISWFEIFFLLYRGKGDGFNETLTLWKPKFWDPKGRGFWPKPAIPTTVPVKIAVLVIRQSLFVLVGPNQAKEQDAQSCKSLAGQQACKRQGAAWNSFLSQPDFNRLPVVLPPSMVDVSGCWCPLFQNREAIGRSLQGKAQQAHVERPTIGLNLTARVCKSSKGNLPRGQLCY